MTESGPPSDPADANGRENDRGRRPSGATPDTGTDVARLSVPKMDCSSCAGKVERSVDRLDGVEDVDARPTTGSVVVAYDSSSVADPDVETAVRRAGYEVAETGGENVGGEGVGGEGVASSRERIWTSSDAIKTWLSGGFVGFGLLFAFVLTGRNATVATVLGREFPVADVLFLVAVAVGGQEIVRNGYYSARNLNLDIDFLMSVAILGALVASLAFGEALYFEAATLAFLFGVAELLERYSMDRARDSLRELMDLSPDEATVVRDGAERTVPVEEVRVGDVAVVRPGERIPLDGTVVDGDSAVDQSPITGESVPVDKTEGDEVFAGSINEGGYLEIEVASAAGDNTLSRIVELVENARADRTEREQFVERFSAYYTPVVVGFAVLVTLASPSVLGTTWATAVVYGLTLLVLACPCAFVISTPVSVVSGITSAARNGVLIEGGSYLEAMGEVDVVALDKTGTLTKGELTVTDVVPLHGNDEAQVLRCARGLERRSEHPVGEAIVAHAEGVGVDDRSEGGTGDRRSEGTEADGHSESGDEHAEDAEGDGRAEGPRTDEREIDAFESITGKGVRADLDGTPHFAGKPGLFEALGFDLSHVHATTDGGGVTRTAHHLCERNDCLDLLEDTVPRLQDEGKTVILVGTEDELEGVVAVADEVRPEAERALDRLKALGVDRTVMLTGDNERTARAIAGRVGVDDYRAELLPDEKVDAIDDLVAAYDGVAMVGDGINDAPALATATVGVAMGAAGADTALETADVALMADDLSKLPYLYELAGDANDVIRQNVFASLGVKAALALGVPFGYVPIWLAVLAGDAGMTTAVTGNAMRLSRVTPEDAGGDAVEA